MNNDYTVKPHDTNVKLVKKFMEWGSPLNQGFVIDSLTKMAHAVADDKEKTRKQFKETGADKFFGVEAWIKCAEDWLNCNDYTVKPHDTNVKLVKKFMEWGSPLNQGFVIDSLTKMAHAVADDKEKTRKQFKETGADKFFGVEAWIQCAEDWLNCMKIRDDNQ